MIETTVPSFLWHRLGTGLAPWRTMHLERQDHRQLGGDERALLNRLCHVGEFLNGRPCMPVRDNRRF